MENLFIPGIVIVAAFFLAIIGDLIVSRIIKKRNERIEKTSLLDLGRNSSPKAGIVNECVLRFFNSGSVRIVVPDGESSEALAKKIVEQISFEYTRRMTSKMSVKIEHDRGFSIIVINHSKTL